MRRFHKQSARNFCYKIYYPEISCWTIFFNISLTLHDIEPTSNCTSLFLSSFSLLSIHNTIKIRLAYTFLQIICLQYFSSLLLKSSSVSISEIFCYVSSSNMATINSLISCFYYISLVLTVTLFAVKLQ